MSTGDRVIRWAAAVSVLTVTAIAVVISYGHTHELVLRYGESGTTAKVLPLTVDGLIATCSLVLLDCARRNRPTPWHAWALLTVAVAATLGANIAHGAGHGPIGALVAGWPAIVAIGAFELLIRMIKDTSTKNTEENTLPITDTPPPDQTGDQDHQDHAATAASESGPGAPEGQDRMLAAARDHFADLLATGQLPSIRALKEQLHLGYTRAAQIRQALATGSPRRGRTPGRTRRSSQQDHPGDE